MKQQNPEYFSPEIHHANDDLIKGFFDHTTNPNMIPGQYIAQNGQIMYPVGSNIPINSNQQININSNYGGQNP